MVRVYARLSYSELGSLVYRGSCAVAEVPGYGSPFVLQMSMFLEWQAAEFVGEALFGLVEDSGRVTYYLLESWSLVHSPAPMIRNPEGYGSCGCLVEARDRA